MSRKIRANPTDLAENFVKNVPALFQSSLDFSSRNLVMKPGTVPFMQLVITTVKKKTVQIEK